MLLTLMLYLPKSTARDLVSCFKPPFVATYAGLLGNPNSELRLVMLIIEPPVFFICFATFLDSSYGAFKLTLYVVSQSSSL